MVLSCGKNTADVDNNVSIFNIPTTYLNVFEQLSAINQVISSLNKKVDEILKPNQVKTTEIGPSSSLIQANTPVEINEEFEAKLKLIRISKSLPDICQLMLCLAENMGTVHCSPFVRAS